MANRIRIQLQTGRENIASKKGDDDKLSAKYALDLIAEVQEVGEAKHKNDRDWRTTLEKAFGKVRSQIESCRRGGGMEHKGRVNFYTLEFRYKDVKYRIDVETIGPKSTDKKPVDFFV